MTSNETPGQSSEPSTPFWQLEDDPYFLEKAKTDPQLKDRLDGLRKARVLAAGNPKNAGFLALQSGMEEAISDYAHQWYGGLPPVELSAEPPSGETPRP